MRVLDRSFFERAPDDVARDLVGVHMTVRRSRGITTVRLVETEAYGGHDDPASHAFRGPTARNAAMFGAAGHLYVYRIYGLHWCMNVVTEAAGVASAVLLRGAEFVADAPHGPGVPLGPVSMRGPGNLTKFLGVTGEDDGTDCCGSTARISFHRGSEEAGGVRQSARIGITKAAERLSRYYLEGSPAVSKTTRGPSHSA